MRQLALDLSTAPSPDFSNFEVADNGLVWQALQEAMQRNWGHEPAIPLLIWGPSGSGKSHLLQAWRANELAAGRTLGWLSPSMASAPSEFSESWATLLLDDVDAWGDDLQAVAFNWLASTQSMLPERRPTVIAASQLPPADWDCRADLRTRLAQGLVLELRPLSEQQRIEVLQRAATARGLVLGDDVVGYMIKRFSRDLTSLMLLLEHMDAYALEHQRALTVPLIKSMLEHS
ncbi:MAG: hypothetical protein RL357_753 [Pseudomonadota bacterium]|jgi:DnaA family protein